MAKRRSWSDDELAALAAIGPKDRAGLADFRARYPAHSRGAINAQLSSLRIRQLAADTVLGRRDDPFPKYRFD